MPEMNEEDRLKARRVAEVPPLLLELLMMVLSNVPAETLDSRSPRTAEEELAVDLWLTDWAEERVTVPPRSVCQALFPRLCAATAHLGSRRTYGLPLPATERKADLVSMLVEGWPELRQQWRESEADEN
jgi:hypothetical protein